MPKDAPADWLFDAVEQALAPATELSARVAAAVRAYREERGLLTGKLPHTARRSVGEAIVANFASTTARVGAATAMAGIVPGIGTVLGTLGGAAADAVLCMKYEVDLVRSLAYLYGHDLSRDNTKRLTFFVTGLGATQDAAKAAGTAIDPRAAVRLVRRATDAMLVRAGKQLFKKVAMVATGHVFQKAIPFGIGVAFGYALNRAMTNRVGAFALEYFEAEMRGEADDATMDIDRIRNWILSAD